LWRYFSFAVIKQESVRLSLWVQNYYAFSVFAYISVYALGIFVGLPVVVFMTMLGGFVYGFWWSCFYSLAAATLGSVLYFMLLRYALQNGFKEKYKGRLEQFKEQIHTYGSSYLLFLHFITIIPFVVINTLAALGDIPFTVFLWTTIAGSLPVIALYSFVGKELGTINAVCDVVRPEFFIVFGLLAVISLVPVIIRKLRVKV
jgi:uncharacterized membrane protein YdjX (TVP38/TMEM64 family)